MWIILPIKATGPVKSRLASVFSPAQREELMRAMLRDVLDAVRNSPHVDGVLLVSRDTDVPAIAAEYGATVLALDEDVDLNSAVRAAADHLHDQGVRRALVLHGDIPLTSAANLDRLMEQAGDAEVALLPCRHQRGTKALLTSLPPRIAFEYGAESFEKHRKNAAKSGKSKPSAEPPSSSGGFMQQTVPMTIAGLIGVVALLAGVIIGIALPSGSNQTAVPTQPAPNAVPQGGAPAPQLSPEQLQGGELPEGHPDIPGGMGGSAPATDGAGAEEAPTN